MRGPGADSAGVDGPASDALLALGRLFTRWEESADGRAAFLKGGRAGDVFYRDRWSYDKVVRSTHGVNCTGLVGAAGGLGGYFPPLVMGATYNEAAHSYTIGLVLLCVTALAALAFTIVLARRAATSTPATVR